MVNEGSSQSVSELARSQLVVTDKGELVSSKYTEPARKSRRISIIMSYERLIDALIDETRHLSLTEAIEQASRQAG